MHTYACISLENDRSLEAEAFLGSQPWLEAVSSANQNSATRYALDMYLLFWQLRQSWQIWN